MEERRLNGGNLNRPLKIRKIEDSDEEPTRIKDDSEDEDSTDLRRILSKSNLIKQSLLNKPIDDLDNYDPLSVERAKKNAAIADQRAKRVNQRSSLKSPSSPIEITGFKRKNVIFLDSEEEDTPLTKKNTLNSSKFASSSMAEAINLVDTPETKPTIFFDQFRYVDPDEQPKQHQKSLRHLLNHRLSL